MKRVGVLRGGTSNNYEKSLKEGGNIFAFLYENLRDKYKPVDILVDRDGVWHLGGVPMQRAEVLNKVDLVWNAGGDHEHTTTLQNFSVPHVGRNAFSLSLENNRELLREHLKKIGIGMPRQMLLPADARQVFEKFSSPWIVESDNSIFLTHTFPELAEAIFTRPVISVTEFISGKPGVVHAIADFRGEGLYVLPPMVVPGLEGAFNDYEKEKVVSFVRALHPHLDAGEYLKANFILHPRRGFFITQISFTPDLREHSHLSQALRSIGAKIHSLVEHLLEKVV